jgi:tetratricopeptide (TPR) repeat protein
MRLSLYVHHLALLASLLALAGCGLQSPWSREYHLRQYEEWRTMGDRARVNDSYSSAREYYQKSLDELGQSGAQPAQLAQGIQDIAETDLLTNNLDDALRRFERALHLYKSHSLSESEEFASSRCLTGYGVTLLKKNMPAEAAAILAEAVPKDVVLRQGGRSKAEPLETLACGWAPQLCEHSCKYWLALCQAPLPSAANSKSEFARLLADPSVCQPVKELVARSYCQVLRGKHDERAARKVEETYGILRNVDTVEAELAQRKWESAIKQGKKLADMGKYAEAKLAFEKAVQISADASPDCPVRRLASLYNLAIFYVNTGNLDRALPLMRECIDIQQARFGDNDRALARPRSLLGSALLSAGQLDRAEPETRKGYELALRAYGSESPFSAQSECILAKLETSRNKFADAEQHITHALSILARNPQRNERIILEAKLNLVKIYKCTGNPEKCLRAADDAASFAQENGSYVEQVQTLQKLALICREQGKRERELQALRKEKEIFNEALTSAKWRKWAEKRMKALNIEFSQLNYKKDQQ